MARKKSAAKKAKEQAEKTKNVTEPVAETPVSKKVEIELAKDERAGSSDDSSSEDEDEYGELLTENVEELIQQVMSALKSDPKKLLDPAVKFFDETDVTLTKKNGDKPMYLKDYHRMNLLSGDYKNDDDENEYGTVDGEKPYAVAEREERNKLIDDIKNAFNDDDAEDEDDDGFLKKKESSKIESALAPKLPDPNTNSEEFLSSFINSQAWIPSKDDKVINLDAIDQEDEQDFDDALRTSKKPTTSDTKTQTRQKLCRMPVPRPL